jgi:hypothetical protein
VPDLTEALKPLVERAVEAEDIFRLIGAGDIAPFGFVQRMPVFELEQLAEIAALLRRKAQDEQT